MKIIMSNSRFYPKIKSALVLCCFFSLIPFTGVFAEDGYRLWLRYDKITDPTLLASYNSLLSGIAIYGNSGSIKVAREELMNGLSGLLGRNLPIQKTQFENGTLIVGKASEIKEFNTFQLTDKLKNIGNEGFLISSFTMNHKNITLITANSDIGVLYGSYHFLKLLQTQQPIENIHISDYPRTKVRILNHWDNLNRTVERGYAGFSIWDWHRLPDYLDPRYTDYARANASVGINGTVLTNVNANALVLTPEYLVKVKALADVFRPYGIRVYLTARFSAPMEIGHLKTADPLDPGVKLWWKDKIEEIYRYVPDFGGFLVKANSEGQPGPQSYGRNHADGANMFAETLAPHGGIVMWRAFVYDNTIPDDRAKQAYNEFKPLDGKFLPNVMIQVKNGPIDFQPREPFHPLFGAMPLTPLMMEFQVTQEYLGFATHLVYLGTLFEECLQADTYSKGKGSLVASIVDGSLDNHTLSGIAGVANIGNDINWCGHPFAQANWYALGRFAWNPAEKAEKIADDWIRMTFSDDPGFIIPVKRMMMSSRENTVNYMTPLGLHHMMGWSHHYGPGPWIKNKQRADWTSVYYHKADSVGVGFDRTSKGSNALGQYTNPVATEWGNPDLCPEKYLLWFHHVSWNKSLKSGNTLWEEICKHYYSGVDSVRQIQKVWETMKPYVDKQRFSQVTMLLAMQEKEAVIWRNSCVLYFQTYSKMQIPKGLEVPEKSLEYYMNLTYSLVPGN
jgi:alpha-glucuronidase